MGTAGFEPGDRKSPFRVAFSLKKRGGFVDRRSRAPDPAPQGRAIRTVTYTRSTVVGSPSSSRKGACELPNDPLTLLASDRSSDSVKGDSGPSEWLPPNRGIHCAPSVRFAQVAASTNYP